MNNKFLINRRKFLKGLGAASILPFIRPAIAAESPKRIIFFYTPDGATNGLWHPNRSSDTNFTLPAMTAPFEAIRDQCVFLTGLKMYGGGGTHEGGAAKVLTGFGSENAQRRVSLDYYLGQYFKMETAFPYLNLGVRGNEWSKPMLTYSPGGIEILSEDNPIAAFDRVFGNMTSPTPGGDLARQLSIIDFVLDEVNQISQRLGTLEQRKIDMHLSSLRDIERRLRDSAGGNCNVDDFNQGGFNPDHGAYKDVANFATVLQLQMDLAVKAFSCDMTRVITIKIGHPVSGEIIIPESGTQRDNHNASHDSDGGNSDSFIKLKSWYNKQLVSLIDTLKNTPEGNGNLMDNTLIFSISEISHNHSHNNMPFVLIGGSNTGLVGGRALSYSNESHSKLLVSIAQLMGLSIDSFGDTSNGSGSLRGLI